MKMPYTAQFFAEATPMIVERNIRGFRRRYPMEK
jgi:hypothetical protein